MSFAVYWSRLAAVSGCACDGGPPQGAAPVHVSGMLYCTQWDLHPALLCTRTHVQGWGKLSFATQTAVLEFSGCIANDAAMALYLQSLFLYTSPHSSNNTSLPRLPYPPLTPPQHSQTPKILGSSTTIQIFCRRSL